MMFHDIDTLQKQIDGETKGIRCKLKLGLVVYRGLRG
jgi:hypothetical protein